MSSSNLFASLVVLAVVVGGSSAQYNTKCRGTVGAGMITPAHFFDVDKMMGNWYIHSIWVGQSGDYHETEGRCFVTEFVRKEPLVVTAAETFFNVSLGEVITVTGDMQIDTTLPLMSTWGTFVNGEKLRDTVWIQTTYDNWALSYLCEMIVDNYRYEMLVLYVRDPTRQLDSHTFEILKHVAKGYGFPPENILPLDNSNCS